MQSQIIFQVVYFLTHRVERVDGHIEEFGFGGATTKFTRLVIILLRKGLRERKVCYERVSNTCSDTWCNQGAGV